MIELYCVERPEWVPWLLRDLAATLVAAPPHGVGERVSHSLRRPVCRCDVCAIPCAPSICWVLSALFPVTWCSRVPQGA